MSGFVGIGMLAHAGAAPRGVLRLGVLGFLGHEQARAQWAPTLQRLQAMLGDVELQLVPLDYGELNTAVSQRSIQMVLTNPEHFAVLRHHYDLRALATLQSREGGQVVDRMGSVVFVHRRSAEIQELDDVRHRRVAAVGLYSLGGFLLAADTLLNRGVDLRGTDVASLGWTGVPHSRVVDKVLAGEADVGIVRTGVLERMAAKGLLDLDDIRVLGLRPAVMFPVRLSTDLAPEWPVAVLPGLDDALVRRLQAALLAFPADAPEAVVGQHAGFVPPANYASVEDLMRRLRTYPSVSFASGLRAMWMTNQTEMALGLSGLGLGAAALSVVLWRVNRRLRRLTALYRDAQQQLQTTATAFDSHVGLLITDRRTRVLRANSAFTTIFGYPEAELRGQPTALLRGDLNPPGRLAALWESLRVDGHWSGELHGRRADGSQVLCMVTITTTRTEAGIEGYVGSFVDMTQHDRDQKAIRQLAFYDVLTGLPNRRLFFERLQQAIEACRSTAAHGALVFIDLDHFKLLNDTQGHLVGDRLLREVAERLQHSIRPAHDLVARLGGDEFVVMMGALSADAAEALGQAQTQAQRLRDALLKPFMLPRGQGLPEEGPASPYHCSGSLGLTLFGAEDAQMMEIMRRADAAMYQAKQAGRNTVRHFDADVNRLLKERTQLSAELGDAVAQGQLALHYQPQVDRLGRVVGAECLLRWHHPARGLVPPCEFIPLAEQSGAILALGHWVLSEALATLARWRSHPVLAQLQLSVNVSPRQFSEPDFEARLADELARSGALPAQLVLEITEGIMVDNPDRVASQMQRLRALGVLFSLDDFGTGYSSLSYLQRLPLSQVKIDRSFMQAAPVDDHSRSIVRAIMSLGNSLGLVTVAEGVETAEQQDLLAALDGTLLMQGYRFGRPVPREDFEAAVATQPVSA